MIRIPAIPESLALAERISGILDDKKATDIALLDVSDLIQITDLFVIASGGNRRHVLTLTDEVQIQMKPERQPLRVEGREEALWVLMDYGDVVVHIFQEQPRHYYDLERLWGDAPRVGREQAASGS